MSTTFGTDEFQKINNAAPDDRGLIEAALLPLRGMVVYPYIITPITIDNHEVRRATQEAIENGTTMIAVAMRDPAGDPAVPKDFFTVGTEIALSRVTPITSKRYSALAQGRHRVEIVEYTQFEPYIRVKARIMDDNANDKADSEANILAQTIVNLFQQAVELTGNMPEEVVNYTMSIDDPVWIGDFVTTTLTLPLEERQKVLEITDVEERLHHIAGLVSRELDMLELKDEISGQIQQEMNRNQREMYLREQMRAIQMELGEEDIFQQEINDLRTDIIKAELPEEAHEKAMKEVGRLAMMPPMAPEVGIIRTYLDWMATLPWTKASEDNLDLKRAQKILDRDHHGLAKIKDRILEHIAVRKLALDKMKSPILCFVGPPGVGKTSLGKSIATALGREFVRVSLGGVRDEAEIRGHRRTYIGAMPGRIIQTMRRAGTVNPVFMLDEIDKLGADFRGDPAAALLEVLDPEQNREYSDHYLDTDYDLSRVLFITTANDLYNMPPALLDRLEVIEFPGYTEEDKLDIARHYLIPKQVEAHGLSDAKLHFETNALKAIIRDYTYEAGVRNLDREIANVCRKSARLLAENRRYPRRVTAEHIEKYLGPPQYIGVRANKEDGIGIVTGLAWTSGGGDILTIEVSLLPGKGNLMLTGQLGDVMQESAQAALSYMRARARDLDVPVEDFENYDLHVHLPEGAVPKDGPSAGITLAIAIISVFTECKIRSDYAMTGEITLRGKVLPVGGIKEKILAAHRSQIYNIILPEANRKDLVDVPPKALRTMNIHFVEDMQAVIDLVLLDAPPEGRERDKYNETQEDSTGNDDD